MFDEQQHVGIGRDCMWQDTLGALRLIQPVPVLTPPHHPAGKPARKTQQKPTWEGLTRTTDSSLKLYQSSPSPPGCGTRHIAV